MNFILRLLVLIVIAAVIETYFYTRVKKSVVNTFPKISEPGVKRFLKLFLVYFNIFPLFIACYSMYLRYTTGNGWVHPIDNEFYTFLLVYPFWIIALLIIQTVVYFFIVDLVRLITYPFRKAKLEQTNNYFQRIIFLIFVLFTVYVPGRVIYDLNAVEVTEYDYVKENLPEVLNNFKVVLIADVQADIYTKDRNLSNYIEKVNELKPDLVLIAGDIITSTPEFIKKAADHLGKIESKYGVYACVGDHDNWAYRRDYKKSLSEITEALKAVDIPMIDNKNLSVPVDSADIGITFVTDNYVTRVSNNIIEKLTEENNSDFKIFLTHQPNQRMVDIAAGKNYNLLFAGHTHGGQLTLLLPYYPSITHIETKYVKGEFRFGDLMMIVNGGLGVSIAPVRYNSTADVSLITLRKK